MSAKSAVTVLRSPSGTSPVAGSAVTLISAVGALEADAGACVASAIPLPAGSGAPHSPQNLNLGGLSNPHLGQRFASGAAQLPQNFMPCGLSVPHFEQRMALPFAKRRRDCRRSFIAKRPGAGRSDRDIWA